MLRSTGSGLRPPTSGNSGRGSAFFPYGLRKGPSPNQSNPRRDPGSRPARLAGIAAETPAATLGVSPTAPDRALGRVAKLDNCRRLEFPRWVPNHLDVRRNRDPETPS